MAPSYNIGDSDTCIVEDIRIGTDENRTISGRFERDRRLAQFDPTSTEYIFSGCPTDQVLRTCGPSTVCQAYLSRHLETITRRIQRMKRRCRHLETTIN
jgi:hypothetical protein